MPELRRQRQQERSESAKKERKKKPYVKPKQKSKKPLNRLPIINLETFSNKMLNTESKLRSCHDLSGQKKKTTINLMSLSKKNKALL